MNNRGLYILVGAVVILFVLFALFWPKPYKWVETYYPDDRNPYDVSILHDVIEKSAPEGTFSEVHRKEKISTLLSEGEFLENSSLISIGNNIFPDSADTKSLLDFANNGNSVYIITENFPNALLDSLFLMYKNEELTEQIQNWKDEHQANFLLDEEQNDDVWENEEWSKQDGEEEDGITDKPVIEENPKINTQDFLFIEDIDHHPYMSYYTDTICHFNFIDENEFEKDLVTIKQFHDKTRFKKWWFFDSTIIQNSNAEIIVVGIQNEVQNNFLKIPYGNGYFYLHSTPIVFSNYNFIKENFYDYASVVFGDLGDGNIIWDESLKFQKHTYNSDYSENNYGEANEGPLTFILSEPGLKWGWYTILFSAFLYLILGVRRNQKPIPVYHLNKNTSIEYADTIGQLYYNKKDHRALVAMKMKQLKSYIQNSYGFRVKFDDSKEKEKIIKRISIQSNLKEDFIAHIFDEYNSIVGAANVSKQMLVSFHDKLEEFYNNCK